jgi:DNA-binding CsgD family transcriptional regulator
MVYTEKELVHLHKCAIYKLDGLSSFDKQKALDLSEATKTMVFTNRAVDFSYGLMSPVGQKFYNRSLIDLNKEDSQFVFDRIHPETSKRLVPAFQSFYACNDKHDTFTDIQVVRRDIDRPYENVLTSTKVSHSGDYLTFCLPTKELGSLGNKIQKELELSKSFQTNLKFFLQLTLREKEVLRLVSLGFTNREVGEQLSISRHTVRTYKMNIYRKLSITSLKELIRYSQVFNLI